jgi:hypothetical protein
VKTARNGYFLLLDLTDIAGSEEKEREITGRLIEEFKVNLAPGGLGFKYPIWGWFRLAFACPESELREGLGRLVNAVATFRGEVSIMKVRLDSVKSVLEIESELQNIMKIGPTRKMDWKIARSLAELLVSAVWFHSVSSPNTC